jgi:hypothetical protein
MKESFNVRIACGFARNRKLRSRLSFSSSRLFRRSNQYFFGRRTMNCKWPSMVLAALLIATPSAHSQETTAKSRIVSVSLFKNGLAVVKREIEIPQAGTYRLDAAPEPVHGTFWIESNAKIEAAVKMRDVEVPLHAEGGMRLQSDLAGKKVTLHFRNDKLGSATGTLVKLAKPEQPEGMTLPHRPDATDHFLILKKAKGRLYVNRRDDDSDRGSRRKNRPA